MTVWLAEDRVVFLFSDCDTERFTDVLAVPVVVVVVVVVAVVAFLGIASLVQLVAGADDDDARVVFLDGAV